MRRLLTAFSFLFFFAVPGNFVSAQGNPQDAHLAGTLTDISGSGVGGVHVSAQLDGDLKASLWKATSTTDGSYALSVPPGRYHVVFTRNSFVTKDFVFDLTAGEQRKLDLQLELERLSSSVVVTAQAEPQPIQQTADSTTIVTREDIDKRKSVALTDTLLYVPGVAIGRTGAEGGTASVFLNGGNSNFTKVLVDGTPVNQSGGGVDFSIFTLDNIDKVEVVRGAESAIYGTDAVSGVIQIFTHRGDTREPLVNVYAEGGNFATGRGGANVSGLLGNFDYSAAGSYFSTDGPDVNNRFINRTLSGNFGYSFSDSNQLRFTLRNNTTSAGTPGSTLLAPPDRDGHTDYANFSANARWDFTTGTHWHHSVSGTEAYNRQFSQDLIQDFYIGGEDSFCPQANPASVETVYFCDFTNAGSKYQYNRAGVNAQSSYLLKNFGATAGYQYEVENAFIQYLGAHHRRNNQGGFLDFRYSPHPRATISAGVRAEANGNFGTRVVPRVGVSLALLQGRDFWGETRFRAFYGEGIKEPRIDQTYGTDICDPGNTALKPESSTTWNVGIEQHLAGNRVKLNGEYFSSRFYDMVTFTSCSIFGECEFPPPVGCDTGFWGTYFNTDKARARGVNFSAEAKISRWLMIQGNYTYDDTLVISAPNAFDSTQLPGNRLLRRPPNSGSVTFLTGYRSFSLTFAGYFRGQSTDSDFLSFVSGDSCFGPCIFHTSGYARFDLATSYEFGRGVSAYVRAQNLLDKQYQDAVGYPALGREVRVGMNYRFGVRNR